MKELPQYHGKDPAEFLADFRERIAEGKAEEIRPTNWRRSSSRENGRTVWIKSSETEKSLGTLEDRLKKVRTIFSALFR